MPDKITFTCDHCEKPIANPEEGIFYITYKDQQGAAAKVQQRAQIKASGVEVPLDEAFFNSFPGGVFHIRHNSCAHSDEEMVWYVQTNRINTYPKLLGLYMHFARNTWVPGTNLLNFMQEFADPNF